MCATTFVGLAASEFPYRVYRGPWNSWLRIGQHSPARTPRLGSRQREASRERSAALQPAVNALRGGHPAVPNQLVELACGNADVHRGFVARQAAARDWPDGGEGGRARHATQPSGRSGTASRRRIEANIRASGHSLGGGWCNPCRDRDDKPDRGPLSAVNQMPSSSRGETQARAALSRSGVSGRIRSRDGRLV